LTVLVDKGKVSVGPSVEEWVRLALERVSVREAPLTKDVVLCAREIYLPHRDPVDTLLAATARFYGLTLVTADEHLLAGRGFSVLANR
jgi:PIN domain nuclease of toxin-antitoxin system